MIIFDTGDLCLRDAVLEANLCGRDVFDQDDLCQGDAVDLADMQLRNPVGEDAICALNTTRVDEKYLCTELGNDVEAQVYRADTTLITADNTSIGADYTL